MLIGDRELGIESPIKKFLKYGGHWKPKKHGCYTSVAIKNEYNTSQTCIYCYKRLSHPYKVVGKNGKKKIQMVNGTLKCDNTNCISSKSKKANRSRDQLSSMGIGLTGCSQLLFGATIPVFDHKVCQSNIDLYNKNTVSIFTVTDSCAKIRCI
ncbi:hypothetical protein K501DRAFT_168406 [Backusella circina FSU 941]|nr:hypothetical protein K501DRAFT_168406 [Backusella circina FSU 941]